MLSNYFKTVKQMQNNIQYFQYFFIILSIIVFLKQHDGSGAVQQAVVAHGTLLVVITSNLLQ